MLTAPDRVLQQTDSPWSTAQLDCLYAIGLYYNGTEFYRDHETYRIGLQKPPSLQTLLGVDDDRWEAEYEPAVDSLVEQGLLRGHDDAEYLLRRPVRWAPTRNGRGVIGDLFRKEFAERYPERVFHYHSGLVGDWDETLTHRFAVALSHAYFGTRSIFASAHRDEDPTYLTRYPGKSGSVRPDLHRQDTSKAVEVITDHNDRESIVSKYARFADSYRTVCWVFDSRETAVRSLSYLHEHDAVDAELARAPYSNPGNYSLNRIRDYLSRSHEQDEYRCAGVTNVETIQSLADHLDSLSFEPASDTPSETAV